MFQKMSEIVLVCGLHQLNVYLLAKSADINRPDKSSFAFYGPTVWNSLPSTLLDRCLSTRSSGY